MGRRTRAVALALLASTSTTVYAQNKANTWDVVGTSGVSAQQLFRGQGGKVYILDKVENNPLQINGHPAWAVEYDTTSNTYRTQEVVTNTFCAGGNVLGNGTWVMVGGNKAVTYGGANGIPGAAPYDNYNGGTAVRMLNPCTDESCNYIADGSMQSERWYPSVETLQDGSLIILGGMRDGGYVNEIDKDNPTIEYFPSKGNQIGLNILAETLPLNLYPLTWLLPSGNLFIQSFMSAEIFDWQNAVEHPLPDIPHSPRVYPATGATVMLPLTPANNWTATLLFCGGTALTQADQWMTSPNWDVAEFPADDTCVSITPDVSSQWQDEDSMFEGRNMGQFIILPDGRLFHLNGIATGTAGYGAAQWAIGQSYGDNPLLTAAYYDPSQPAGKRWQRPASLEKMTVQRLYHSSATLLADGSIFNAGSNPNADYIPEKGYKEDGVTYTYPTEYRVEMFYPDYYDETKPQPQGLPETLTYGGNYFNISLSATDLNNTPQTVDTVKVVVMRTGYSTHGMNFGQRYVQLNSTWTLNEDGSAIIHTAQMPPNAGIMAPGPALMFVVVNGTPSVGQDIMVGNGQMGMQTMNAVPSMPGTLSQSGAVITTANGKSSISTAASASVSEGDPNGTASKTSTTVTVLAATLLAFVIGTLM